MKIAYFMAMAATGASIDVLNGYFNGSDSTLELLDPKSSEKFKVNVTNINDVSKTNLSGKAYKGAINGWPGNMTGKEVLASMIERGAASNKSFDYSRRKCVRDTFSWIGVKSAPLKYTCSIPVSS